MESFIKEFEHLKIPLEKIKSATNNFDRSKIIGRGGFGLVYRGELSHFKGHGKVAIKRLDRKSLQGGVEFWDEITVLTRHPHENLIALLGFCIESDEMILVYEYASNRSLDHHLRSPVFTWRQRLNICLDAAMGLSYLHDAKGSKETIIHSDIKSSNILLDAYWNAKVSDLGLSKTVPANWRQMGLVANPAGTPGYCDPMYIETCFLTKESDVYSFGVLLLEVLCGKLCYEYGNGQIQIFVHEWKESYEQNKLQEIIFDDLKKQMDQNSLKTYSDIAFKCLHNSREERPTMPHVVEELETALTYQELYERVKLPKDYTKMLMITAEDPLNNIPEAELKMLLLKGTLLNSGKTWFSLNADGEHCEMLSIAECLTSTASESPHYIHSSEYISRFAVGCYEPSGEKFKTHVEHEVVTDDKVDMQPISDDETYWERKLPIDYEDIIKRSKDTVQWKTKKDLYYILCKGFLISYGEEWFYLAEDGKKCLMLPARTALEEDRWEWKSEPKTMFFPYIPASMFYCIHVSVLRNKSNNSPTPYGNII